MPQLLVLCGRTLMFSGKMSFTILTLLYYITRSDTIPGLTIHVRVGWRSYASFILWLPHCGGLQKSAAPTSRWYIWEVTEHGTPRSSSEAPPKGTVDYGVAQSIHQKSWDASKPRKPILTWFEIWALSSDWINKTNGPQDECWPVEFEDRTVMR